jgi:hypothetical protein
MAALPSFITDLSAVAPVRPPPPAARAPALFQPDVACRDLALRGRLVQAALAAQFHLKRLTALVR